jgi:enoyl-CoA hydratase/carnithine racemase
MSDPVSPEPATLRVEVRDAVAEILFDRPPVNALTDRTLAELLAALERARDDDRVRAVIVGSAVPERFCAGLDLKALRRKDAAGAHATLHALYARLTDLQFGLGKPSIAAVGGAVRGGGITVAISCDLIVADASADFGYPEMDVGLLPAIHYTHLHRIVGRYRAFDLLFTGRTFTAQEAHAIGLVSRLAPAGGALEHARAIARGLAAKSPQLMRRGKAAFVAGIDAGYRQGVSAAVDLLASVLPLEDSREALAAFEERRRPTWRD